MNIHIITQSEPFYIPKMINYILTNKDSNINVVGFTVLKPHRKNKNIYHWFQERAKIYSFIELFNIFFAFGYVKFFSLLGKRYSARKIFLSHNVKSIDTYDINY